MTGPHVPSTIAAQPHQASGAQPPEPDVGEILRRMDAGRVLSAEELEQHIADCSTLWQRAYASFREHHSPTEREEALFWLHQMNQAILTRPGMHHFFGRGAR